MLPSGVASAFFHFLPSLICYTGDAAYNRTTNTKHTKHNNTMKTIMFDNRPPIRISPEVWAGKQSLRDGYAHLDFGSDKVCLLGPTDKGNYIAYHYWKGAYEGDGSSRTCLAIGPLATVLAALDCPEYRDAHNKAIELGLAQAEAV